VRVVGDGIVRSVANGTVLLVLGVWGCAPSDGPAGKEPSSPTGTLFVDITQQSGVRFAHDPVVSGSYYYPEVMGSGGGFLDYDNDGDLDIYLVNGAGRGLSDGDAPRLRNRLFRQEQDGTFVDVTETSGLGDTGFGMGIAVGDIDNDGDVDVYVTNVGPDVLYRNEGDGTFTDVTEAAGIANAEWGASATFFDFDRDGHLDIYVANYVAFDTTIVCTDLSGRRDYCGPPFYSGVADVLYRNNGDGTFSDVSAAVGITSVAAAGLGVVAADFTGDAYPDIYVANDGEPNQLWINQRDGTVRDEALGFGVAVNALGHAEAGMGIAIGDSDNDGAVDLFVTHLRGESNTLYRSGSSAFYDETFRAGMAGPSIPFTGFGTGFVDYDNDGDLDLILVNGRVLGGPLLTSRDPAGYWDVYAEPNLVFENDGLGRFRDVSDGEPEFSHDIANSRGLAFGDIDNDGDVDFLITIGGGEARLIRNNGTPGAHWLLVRAVNPTLNRDAIGAGITVVAGERRFYRLIISGYSYMSSNDLRAHFGLGGATAVDEIVVLWPDGTKEVFPGTGADQIITLEKGRGTSTNE